MNRVTWAAGGIVAGTFALLGALFVATAVISTDDPRNWLDEHATRVSATSWTAPEPPLRYADRIAGAVRPQSRVVSTWGVALRYGRGTLTVTAGSAGATSAVYWDSTRSGVPPRRWHIGRWSGGGGFDPVGADPAPSSPGGAGSGTTRPSSAELVQTRRGEDFRGGGPGGGK